MADVLQGLFGQGGVNSRMEVCVCVRERERKKEDRERERETERERKLRSPWLKY